MKKEEKTLMIEFLRTAKYYYFTVLPFLVRHVVLEYKEDPQVDLGYLFYLQTGGKKAERKASKKARKKLGEKSLKAGAF